jgi:hypothetical protein
MRKALMVLIVVLSFMVPLLAWAQSDVQPRGTHTVYLREAIPLELKRGVIPEVFMLQASSVGFASHGQSMAVVQITHPDYTGRILYIPITNIKVIITNK